MSDFVAKFEFVIFVVEVIILWLVVECIDVCCGIPCVSERKRKSNMKLEEKYENC